MKLRDTVVHNGIRLYAPMIACRPVRFEDYSPERLAIHKKAVSDTGAKLNIYPGSAYLPCEDCDIEVAVGPRQQEAIELANSVGLRAHVLCFVDAGQRAAADSSSDPTAMHLGNPFKQE